MEEWSWREPEDVKLLKQVLTWCKAQLPNEERAPMQCPEESKPVIDGDTPEGTVLLTKKDDKDDFFIAPTAKHKSHRHHKHKKDVAISHDLQSLKLFASLELEMPATPQDCQKIIKDLEARLAVRSEEEERRSEDEAAYWRRKQAEHPQSVEDEVKGKSKDRKQRNVWSLGPTRGPKAWEI